MSALEIPKCSECPENMTIEEAYQGSLYCKQAIQEGKCPKFEWYSNHPKVVRNERT